MAASATHEVRSPQLPSRHIKASKHRTSRKGKGKELTSASSKLAPESSRSYSDEAESVWPWTSLTEPSASNHPPIFTKDGSYFFSIVGSTVKIFSVATGQVVSTLYASSQEESIASSSFSGDITSAVLNPHNAFQLITGSLSGAITVWDFLDGVILQSIGIGQPIHHICAHAKFKDCVFVAVSRRGSESGDNDNNGVVLRVSLVPSSATSGSPVQKSSEIIAVGKTKSTAGLAVSPSGTWLVAISGHKAYVAKTSTPKLGFTKYVSPEKLTCLVFHPSEEYFATGDTKGEIRLWYCLNEHIATSSTWTEKKAQTTALHWHAHAVSSIAFTPNGAYLLSGGEESVLVIWQLHTGKKEFVPRLGAPIKAVASCQVEGEEEYLLGLADATYVFVSAKSLKISRSYSRIKLDPSSHLAPGYAFIAVHSLTSTLILPSSHPSSLQIYSPSSSTLVSELEVSPSNRVSRRDEKPLQPTRVEKVAVSSSGKWMATIDRREEDDGFRGEVYLKFWFWDRSTAHWILNTRIDRPHGPNEVTAMAFSPEVYGNDDLNIVTTGKDGNAKTWRIQRSKNKAGHAEEFWVPRSTFSFRFEIPTHASWSPDGSLLAITMGPYLTLYDLTGHAPRHAVTFPGCKAIKCAHFVGHSGHDIVVTSAEDVILWDLVGNSVRWHHKSVSILGNVVPHPSKDAFAVFHTLPASKPSHHQTRVSIYHASSPNAISTYIVPFTLLSVSWYPYIPLPAQDMPSFSLVGITNTWQVVVLGDAARLPKQSGSSPAAIFGSHSTAKRTLFQDIFGKSAFMDIPHDARPLESRTTESYPRGSARKEVAQAFDGPAFLIPPLESLFDPLMNAFLKERAKPEADGGRPELDDDDDVDMEDAGDELVVAETLAKRTVSQEEMAILVELFKTHAWSPNPLQKKNSAKTNGVQKSQLNGDIVYPPMTSSTPNTPNGITAKVKTSAQMSEGTPDLSSLADNVGLNRNKRKKSLA